MPYEGMLPSLLKYKLMYVAINLVLLGLVLYKMAAMGMLPVLAADYADLMPPFEVYSQQKRPLESWLPPDPSVYEYSYSY